jgi:hypothetical protein
MGGSSAAGLSPDLMAKLQQAILQAKMQGFQG